MSRTSLDSAANNLLPRRFMPTVQFDSRTVSGADLCGETGRTLLQRCLGALCSYPSGKCVVRPDSDIAGRVVRFHRATRIKSFPHGACLSWDARKQRRAEPAVSGANLLCSEADIANGMELFPLPRQLRKRHRPPSSLWRRAAQSPIDDQGSIRLWASSVRRHVRDRGMRASAPRWHSPGSRLRCPGRDCHSA